MCQVIPMDTGDTVCTHRTSSSRGTGHMWHYTRYARMCTSGGAVLTSCKQLVQAKVAEVASEYPDSTRARMQNLASEFRVPYWDWAMHPPENDSIYPIAMSTQTAQVTLPNGTETTIPNPLFSYSFHPMIHDDLYFSVSCSHQVGICHDTD